MRQIVRQLAPDKHAEFSFQQQSYFNYGKLFLMNIIIILGLLRRGRFWIT